MFLISLFCCGQVAGQDPAVSPAKAGTGSPQTDVAALYTQSGTDPSFKALLDDAPFGSALYLVLERAHHREEDPGRGCSGHRRAISNRVPAAGILTQPQPPWREGWCQSGDGRARGESRRVSPGAKPKS